MPKSKIKLNNLQENCPYYDKNNRKCTRKGCHLLRPCIAKGRIIDNYYSISDLLKNMFIIIKG